jgi:hypothetical protein
MGSVFRFPLTKEGLRMLYPSESKIRGWRAVAVFADGSECLLYLGRSTTQVRAGYAAAFREVLNTEEQAGVQTISLECWQGVPDAGTWMQKSALAIPTEPSVAAA